MLYFLLPYSKSIGTVIRHLSFIIFLAMTLKTRTFAVMKLQTLTLILLTVLPVSCRRHSGYSNENNDRPTVTVSIAPQAWILEAIAGDSIRINTLLDTGANPETFEPGINNMKLAAESSLLLLSGNLGVERQLAERLRENTPGLTISDTSRGIKPIYGTHDHAGHHHHDHAHETADPHTWTSVRNARIIAGNMLSALISVDPDNETYYRNRASRLDSQLDSLDSAIASRFEQLQSRTFMIWHPSLSYFARDYGLEQISVGMEGRETTVQGLRSIIDRAQSSGAPILFVQSDFDPRQAETLSRETGARVITISPLDHDWISQINIITDALDPR